MMTFEFPRGDAVPVTPVQWKLYLAECDNEYPSDAGEGYVWHRLTREQRKVWMAHPPATEQRVAATEQRLGVSLPPSLRGFLMASDGWGPVSGSGWMPAIGSCEEIDWFRNTHAAFVSAHLAGGARGDDDIFLSALSLARGDDTVLLDTRRAGADGEYEAYFFAVKFGDLDEPCASFGQLIGKSRARSERIRSLLGGR